VLYQQNLQGNQGFQWGFTGACDRTTLNPILVEYRLFEAAKRPGEKLGRAFKVKQ